LAELEAEANRLFQTAVSNLIEEGNNEAYQGNIPQALSLFDKAQKLNSDVKINANSWNSLCRNGSIYGYADKVLNACEKAVELALDEDKVLYIDSRGLARALTGNTQGAIADFQFYVDSPNADDSDKTQRQEWIKALKQGENPFTDRVLEELKNQ
jgi:tetratricopeptide (TPR) repeat protein